MPLSPYHGCLEWIPVLLGNLGAKEWSKLAIFVINGSGWQLIVAGTLDSTWQDTTGAGYHLL
jgi:hypothetical protein